MEILGFPAGSDSKEPACSAGDLGRSLGWEDALEKGMATHSSILAWEIPWTEESYGLQSMGLQRVGHNLAAKQKHRLYNTTCTTPRVQHHMYKLWASDDNSTSMS